MASSVPGLDRCRELGVPGVALVISLVLFSLWSLHGSLVSWLSGSGLLP